MDKGKALILWFDQLGIEDVKHVGGKNASLGEMYKNLTDKGVNIPNGYAVTAHAYHYLLDHSKIREKIKKVLSDLNTKDVKNLAERGKKVRDLIRNAKLPKEVEDAIKEGYHHMQKQYGKNTDVAVRSSATAEDLPDASFAGQQETYLNIKGDKQLVEACKNCFASLFTNRAISYREDKGFDHFSIGLSIGVQKMVRSDKANSGVMFSIDTESGFQNVVFITAAYGLGENVVQGAVNPDEYYVFKPTMKKGFKSIISKKIGDKKIRMVYAEGKTPTKNIPVKQTDREKFVLSDDELIKLSEWACIIEDHYSHKAGHYKPMDMEWAKDGNTNELFIVQARPETVHSQKSVKKIDHYELRGKGNKLVTGKSVGEKIGAGKVNMIMKAKDIHKFNKGDVLVTDMTDPDWEPIMKIAAAIVTNRGGRTCFSGDTKILTDKGFRSLKNVFEGGYEGLKVPSLNRKTLKTEWKNIQAVMKKKGKLIKTCSSQSGRMKNNFLKITPDHKMLNIRDGKLIDSKIKDILNNKECLLVAQSIPQLTKSTQKEQNIAYLLGGLMTDGHIYQSRTHGEVTFIQKPIEEKKRFITKMNKCLQATYNKTFRESPKKPSEGFIRGEKVIGNANSYRCYSKLIARELKLEMESITEMLLQTDESVAYNFLGGVIDGDGTFSKGRISIYISKQELLEPVIISCLRIGIVPQVSTNRNIHNVQIVEKLNELNRFTKRVTCKDFRTMGTRFFNTKQLFRKWTNSEINNRIRKNLLIDEKLISTSLNLLDKKTKSNISRILSSDFRQTRVSFVKDLGVDDVYNITVEDNHNYIVFSERYTPLLVNNCHAAIISREMGIPCIVGTGNGTEKLKDVKSVTVDCSQGEEGYVYEGLVTFGVKSINLENIPKTRTKIMMNLGSPEHAFEYSFLPNDGVGLAREEFIINSHIGIHPNALLNFNSLKDKKVKAEIEKRTKGYEDKTEFFVDKLAEGVAILGAAFYPNDVIVRLSDFKSNEYANLVGGKLYEPVEENPMIGWRGASRYYNVNYKDAFALECRALKKVRDVFGLTNIKIMVPFCRTVEEGKKVLAEMEKNGLKRGENHLEVYVMCEIPSNVILADQFAEIFDGFSIGSNDLTQLTLGLDRDSELVSSIYDERNEAVKRLISQVIHTAKEKNRKIGICGQAPSDYEDFAQFLVEQGIDSISLNPDTVIKTRLKIAEKEAEMKNG
ncbi:phosphoenolpyruvate synthase [Candidatus Woesearchaeota archaeon]|nr:phosphoenolpyruvate synthase [Candidatus Woesearchaeota archaeon]